jgi:hypothetical protein
MKPIEEAMPKLQEPIINHHRGIFFAEEQTSHVKVAVVNLAPPQN